MILLNEDIIRKYVIKTLFFEKKKSDEIYSICLNTNFSLEYLEILNLQKARKQFTQKHTPI